MPQIRVRFANLRDLEVVSQDQFIPVEVVARKIEWREVIIAEVDGKPVGYLRLEYLWSIVPYIALITVDPAHRRVGVGRAMLDFTLAYLSENNHEWLYSSSQADEPEPQAWHRHMGFQDCGIITGINEGGVSEVFFRRKIRG
jgi:ribosomal protein S18 acetylase RimI-like enzyme